MTRPPNAPYAPYAAVPTAQLAATLAPLSCDAPGGTQSCPECLTGLLFHLYGDAEYEWRPIGLVCCSCDFAIMRAELERRSATEEDACRS